MSLRQLEQRVARLEQRLKEQIGKQRRIQHKVIVNGVEYRSTHTAFEALGFYKKGWNETQAQWFRADLKGERQMIVEHDGRYHDFRVVPRRVTISDYRKV